MLNLQDQLEIECTCGNVSDFKYLGIQWIPLTKFNKESFRDNHYHDIIKRQFGYKLWMCNICQTSLVSGRDNKPI